MYLPRCNSFKNRNIYLQYKWERCSYHEVTISKALDTSRKQKNGNCIVFDLLGGESGERGKDDKMGEG